MMTCWCRRHLEVYFINVMYSLIVPVPVMISQHCHPSCTLQQSSRFTELRRATAPKATSLWESPLSAGQTCLMPLISRGPLRNSGCHVTSHASRTQLTPPASSYSGPKLVLGLILGSRTWHCWSLILGPRHQPRHSCVFASSKVSSHLGYRGSQGPPFVHRYQMLPIEEPSWGVFLFNSAQMWG